MTTDWMRKHVNPKLIAKYEKELAKLRGETSSKDHILENIKKMNEQVDQVETDEERRARDLEEDAAMEEFFKKHK